MVYVTIYLDLILALSFLFNGAILYVVTYIMKQQFSMRQLLFGTSLATLFVPLIVYFPQSFLNTIVGKGLYSIVIIVATIGIKPLHHLFRSLITFYVVSFLTGGAILSVHFLLANSVQEERLRSLLLYVPNINRMEVSVVVLVIGFLVTLLVVKKWTDGLILERFMSHQLYNVQLTWNGKQYSTMAFLDSGNHLVDPLTNRPVIICDALFMKQFFQREDWYYLQRAIQANDATQIPAHLIDKFRLIPFTSVANSHILYALKPDKLIVESSEHRFETKDVLVGIQLSPIVHDRQYHCLLHPQLVVLTPSETVSTI